MTGQKLRGFESLETRLLMAGDVGETFDIPLLHSNPNSAHTIYLDFDGQIVSGTTWNATNRGDPIHAPAFSLDDDIFAFNADEVDKVMEIQTPQVRTTELAEANADKAKREAIKSQQVASFHRDNG